MLKMEKQENKGIIKTVSEIKTQFRREREKRNFYLSQQFLEDGCW